MVPVFRFAPSPNGHLHLGHALSALINFESARKTGGRFLLRIEDIDQSRARVHLIEQILDDLAWLGLKWETPVLKQSTRFDRYIAATTDLSELNLTYKAAKTRKQISRFVSEYEDKNNQLWPRDPDGAPFYPRYENEPDTASFSIRLDMARALKNTPALGWYETGSGPDNQSGEIVALPHLWSDVVIGRKDCPTSYHLSVVLDDAMQGITHIVRGADLFWSTSVHRLLQHLLKLPEPVYHHHRLITDTNGHKLSKSLLSKSILDLRNEGCSPDDIRDMCGFCDHDLVPISQRPAQTAKN